MNEFHIFTYRKLSDEELNCASKTRVSSVDMFERFPLSWDVSVMPEVGCNSSLKMYLRDILSLSFFFGRRFLYASLMRAVSNLLKIASLFLPLKVLIVLSSSSTPFYFQYLAPYAEVETILLGLTLAVPVIYLIYIVLGVFYLRLLDADFKVLKVEELKAGFPLVTQKNAEKVHQKLAIALSELFLISIAIVLVALVELYFSAILLLLVVFNLFFLNKYLYSSKAAECLTKASFHRQQVIEHLASCNFLLVFFLLVAGVYYLSLNVFSAVLTLLVARMVFRSLTKFSQQSFFLKKLLLG